VNPGNLDTGVYDNVEHQPAIKKLGLKIFTKLMLHPTVMGAYSELFAGLSPQVTMEKSAEWSRSSGLMSAAFLANDADRKL
jgi:retinol dehydrogenase-12